jgi:hypothetical protein
LNGSQNKLKASLMAVLHIIKANVRASASAVPH